MTITSLAIVSQTERGTDQLIYVQEFKSSNPKEGNDHADLDIDLDLFDSVIEQGDDDASGSISTRTPQSANDCSLRHQFILQSSLEKMNQDIKFDKQLRTTFNDQFQGIEYMWVGLICPIDEYRVYGYITNTNVKIIAAVEDVFLPEQKDLQQMRDEEIKKIFKNIHGSYVDYLLNPFSNKHGKIKSQRFDARMEELGVLRGK